ncbi:fumarate hydratase [Bdellovibrio bacteriovorus]|uniref:Fumarate hydratase class I n=1 Tax=Bdellovibrio bacteriovorus str. Tiberius TaxID=1069642 RepID=K7YPM5_BDEBC|nr:fumarate hydratase [Bdellovibrio bacteriovorus]AFY01801.1 fumarate hydratase, class I [Bdellovibrio bacteriovorus str. Tiberius]
MSFKYFPLYEKQKDTTQYKKISSDHVRVEKVGEREVLIVEPEALELLAQEALSDVSHLLRPKHLEKLEKILQDPEASPNDRFVAVDLLRNAVIAAQMEFPSCQDTGTAIVVGKKGERVFTGADDKEFLSKGIFNTYQKRNLRFSQMAPISFFEEKNTGSNLPAQIDIYSEQGEEYNFLFLAKGGGSANKSYLYQKTKAVLNPEGFEKFVRETLNSLGTAACPPYHLAFCVGGTSAEETLKIVKYASAGYLDGLPTTGSEGGRAYRDLEMEKQVEQWARETGIGAQFGGKYFVHDVRVIRLPRHGASCPIGVGVSCSADRNIKGKITRDGIFLEQLELHPEQYLPNHLQDAGAEAIEIDLNKPMAETLKVLSQQKVATRVMLNGPMIVARDIAHAKLKEKVDRGEGVPQYFKDYAVYYAGPAKTPKGYASGSFGPTTSERMDPYVGTFQALGGSMIMLGKGNRSPQVTEACKQYGGFYLGSIGGPAARLGKECITKVEVLDFPELGMESVWKIEVKDFPAFIIVDDKGNDFFKSVIKRL